MRTLKYAGAFLLAILLAGGVVLPTKVQAQPGISVSFDMFFNSISPYGRWTSHPQYGSVWYPAVDRNFHPYSTNGHWVMTEYGNTWVSDYNWGWAPFHYGRWFYDEFYGWAWVPDYSWGPGWVDWRTGGDYYGWAPLLPGFNVRVSVSIPINFWVFVPQRHFMSSNWRNYIAPPRHMQNIYNRTTVINNYYYNDRNEYNYGPRRSDIERYGNRSVQVYDYSRSHNNGRYQEVVTQSNRSNQDGFYSRERSFDNPSNNGRVNNNPTYNDRGSSNTSRSDVPRTYENNSRVPDNGRTSNGNSYPDRVATPSNNGGYPSNSRTETPSRTTSPSAPSEYRGGGSSSSGRSGGYSPAPSSRGSVESRTPSAPSNSGRTSAPAPSNGGGRSSGNDNGGGNSSRSR